MSADPSYAVSVETDDLVRIEGRAGEYRVVSQLPAEGGGWRIEFEPVDHIGERVRMDIYPDRYGTLRTEGREAVSLVTEPVVEPEEPAPDRGEQLDLFGE
jgi:hypothetical protein